MWLQFLAELITRIAADSELAVSSLPEPPCESLACDAFGRTVLIVAALCLISCVSCVVYNNLSYFVAERTPDLPYGLRVRSTLRSICNGFCDKLNVAILRHSMLGCYQHWLQQLLRHALVHRMRLHSCSTQYAAVVVLCFGNHR